MNKTNNSEPWGTPLFTSFHEDDSPLFVSSHIGILGTFILEHVGEIMVDIY